MTRAAALVLVVPIVSALHASASSQSKSRVNHPPAITTTLPEHAVVSPGVATRFTVTVTDPEGDRVSARVLSAPVDLVIAPIVRAPSGTTRDVVWYPTGSEWGPQELVIEAWDVRRPKVRVRERISIAIGGAGTWDPAKLIVRDLDGDAAMEVVAHAPDADFSGAVDVGAIARFEPGTVSPPRSSRSPSVLVAPNGGRLGPGGRFGDVTGDGLDDVIASFRTAGNHNARLAVFRGDASDDDVAARAVLTSSDKSGSMRSIGDVILEDVTNDGVLDVLVSFPDADTSATDAGEIRIFEGGPGMLGAVAPLATLQVPGAAAGDHLGGPAHVFPLRLEDVTGDGIRDVVVVAPDADVAGQVDQGCLYVWAGGASLSGTIAPTATLATSGALLSSRLGDAGVPMSLVHFADLTGDGSRDVVAVSPQTVGGGAIFLWPGGAGLSGTLDASADLVSSSRASGDAPGNSFTQVGAQFADLDLDGVVDLVAAAPGADVAKAADAGAILVFAGGALAGTVTETARLRLASPAANDQLTSATAGPQIADVTGDGLPDVVEGSPFTGSTGAIHVWSSQPGMHGDVFPSASLEASGATLLTIGNQATEEFGTGLVVADVTGDGVLDVTAVAGLTDLGIPGSYDEGAIYVWKGGAALAAGGVVAPDATLLDPVPGSAHYLGVRFWDYGAAVRTIDFDGDGIRDLVACESLGYGFYGYFPNERILVWSGGAGLVGSPAPAATIESGQGSQFTHGGRDVRFADLTSDGFLDLIASDSAATDPSGSSNGVIFVFAGGPTAAGALPVHQRLEDRSGAAIQLTMEGFGTVTDVDADGALDVLVANPAASVELPNQGALLWFRGPFTGAMVAPIFFTAPMLGADALLGN